jgi:predicted lipid-binding transport protein (Tim44 family)
MLMPGLVMLGSRAAGWVRSGRAARHRRSGTGAAIAPGLTLPDGLDASRLLDAARAQFIDLQAAWDAADRATLAALTTPEMLVELSAELPLAEAGPNCTEVLSLHAKLLAFDDFGSTWLASIEFSGMIRESPDRAAMPFRELWILTRDRTGAASTNPPWRLARHQALL